MGLAVVLLFDGATTAAVQALWERLAGADIGTSMLDLGYLPHVTLTVMQNEGLATALRHKLAQQAWGEVLNLQIGPVDRFEGTDIVWLGCAGDRLRAMQRAVSGLVAPDEIEPHYRPENWVPHMTLQTSGDAEMALARAAEAWPAQVGARAEVVELVRFPPVEPIWRATLSADL